MPSAPGPGLSESLLGSCVIRCFRDEEADPEACASPSSGRSDLPRAGSRGWSMEGVVLSCPWDGRRRSRGHRKLLSASVTSEESRVRASPAQRLCLPPGAGAWLQELEVWGPATQRHKHAHCAGQTAHSQETQALSSS